MENGDASTELAPREGFHDEGGINFMAPPPPSTKIEAPIQLKNDGSPSTSNRLSKLWAVQNRSSQALRRHSHDFRPPSREPLTEFLTSDRDWVTAESISIYSSLGCSEFVWVEWISNWVVQVRVLSFRLDYLSSLGLLSLSKFVTRSTQNRWI